MIGIPIVRQLFSTGIPMVERNGGGGQGWKEGERERETSGSVVSEGDLN